MISEADKGQLRRLMESRQARDEAKKASDNAETEFREVEADVYESLRESGLQGALKVDLGDPWGVVAFVPRETFFARIIDDAALQTYYEQRAMVEEVTAPKFVKKRLHEEVRDCLENDRKMPPGLDWYANRGVTITRQKS